MMDQKTEINLSTLVRFKMQMSNVKCAMKCDAPPPHLLGGKMENVKVTILLSAVAECVVVRVSCGSNCWLW